jgi:hypothetical protein
MRNGALIIACVGMTVTVVAGGRPARAATDDEVRAARRVLERGYELPPGLTLARGRKDAWWVNRSPDRPDRVRARARPMLSGTFERDGDTISFEVIRGARKPKHERPERGESRYVLDVCLKDSHGRPFLVQIGGDDALDQSCEPDLEEEPPEDATARGTALIPEERDASFRTAEAAIATLGGLEFKKKFAAEHEALVGMGHLLERAQAELDCDDENVICEEGDPATLSQPRSHNNRWQHIIEIWQGPVTSHVRDYELVRFPDAIGTHGATVAFRRDYRNGSISAAWQRCNHGKCPYHRRMSFKCRLFSWWNRRYHIHNETCVTNYALFSGQLSRGHNCNDDTYMQYRAVRLNRHAPSGWGTGYPCDDRYNHAYTKGCW